MKQLLIFTVMIVSLGTSSIILAEGNHPHSDDRDVMRVHRSDIDNDAKNTTHADKKKSGQLDTRKMKSQIITGTKKTGQKYSEGSPISQTTKHTSHPLRIKRMGDH